MVLESYLECWILPRVWGLTYGLGSDMGSEKGSISSARLLQNAGVWGLGSGVWGLSKILPLELWGLGSEVGSAGVVGSNLGSGVSDIRSQTLYQTSDLISHSI